MPKYKIKVNGTEQELDVDNEMVGTKYGCGIAQCGACTVHIDDAPVRSCSVRVSDVTGRSIRTIEGLSEGSRLHSLQQAWIEVDVAQCGYCQAGQLMSAAALLKDNPDPSDADIDVAMAGNYCRCGTYNRIRSAIHTAAAYENAASQAPDLRQDLA